MCVYIIVCVVCACSVCNVQSILADPPQYFFQKYAGLVRLAD